MPASGAASSCDVGIVSPRADVVAVSEPLCEHPATANAPTDSSAAAATLSAAALSDADESGADLGDAESRDAGVVVPGNEAINWSDYLDHLKLSL